MRKKILLVFLALVVLAIGGCGNSEKEVPAEELEFIVSDYFDANLVEGYNEKYYEAEHEWNADNNTDTVKLQAITEYQYGNIIAECEYVFQYDKSSDLWQIRRNTEWEEYADYKKEEWIGKTFEDLCGFNDVNYVSLVCKDVDFETDEIEVDYIARGVAKTSGGLAKQEYDVDFSGSTKVLMNRHVSSMSYEYTENGNKRELEFPIMGINVKIDNISFGAFVTVKGLDMVYLSAEWK